MLVSRDIFHNQLMSATISAAKIFFNLNFFFLVYQNNVTISSKIGEGNFGSIFLGNWIGIQVKNIIIYQMIAGREMHQFD